jgi:CHAT domain-containing protein
VLLCQQSVRDKKGGYEESLSDALHNLYNQIWEPLSADLLAGANSVVISPDASLNFVSFATLLTPDDKFLAEKYSIRYVASGRDLLGEAAKSTNQDMIIFAAPDYHAGGDLDSADAGTDLLPLPYFAKNADDLEAEAKQWNWPVHVYSGAKATESEVRAIHSPRILHFATHGFFLPETIGGPARFSFLGSFTDSKGAQQQVTLRNPMYRSGIALASAQVTLDAWKRGETPPTDTDGILTAEEVGELDLHGTWLVVLSACDTGIGEPRAGEGVMGLRRGFIQAGAQNLLMTLWPVYDVPSGKLMLDFYSTLHQNNNPPEALAKVQRDWLVKLRSKYGLLPAIIMAGAFIVNSQGPIQQP